MKKGRGTSDMKANAITVQRNTDVDRLKNFTSIFWYISGIQIIIIDALRVNGSDFVQLVTNLAKIYRRDHDYAYQKQIPSIWLANVIIDLYLHEAVMGITGKESWFNVKIRSRSCNL
jgi:hypothetical protein